MVLLLKLEAPTYDDVAERLEGELGLEDLPGALDLVLVELTLRQERNHAPAGLYETLRRRSPQLSGALYELAESHRSLVSETQGLLRLLGRTTTGPWALVAKDLLAQRILELEAREQRILDRHHASEA